MNLNQAIQNIVQVLQFGRITLPGGPMTAQEHSQLQNDFNLLVDRAKLADKLEKERDQLDKIVKSYEKDARDNLPEPEHSNVEESNESLDEIPESDEAPEIPEPIDPPRTGNEHKEVA